MFLYEETELYKSNLYSLGKLLSVVIILIGCLSIFNYYFTTIFRGISFYLVIIAMAWIVLINLKNMNIVGIKLKQCLCLSIWGIGYIFINQFILNYEYYNTILGIKFNVFTLQTIGTICIFLMYIFITNVRDIKFKKYIIRLIIISFIINSIISLRAIQIDPNISRVLATGLAEKNIYQLKGVSGYSIIYSIVIIMPLIFYALTKSKGRERIFLSLFSLLMVFFVYKAAYTTAIIALILGIIIYIFLNTSKWIKVILVIPGVIILLFIINPYLIYQCMTYIANSIPIVPISMRINELAELIFLGDSSGESLIRIELYKKSISAFTNHPIGGTIIFNPDYKLSGHSSILDIMGGMGLMGIIPYIMFIWYTYKIAIKNISLKKCINAVKTCFIIFIFISVLNPAATSYSIMIVLLIFIKVFPEVLEEGDKTKGIIMETN